MSMLLEVFPRPKDESRLFESSELQNALYRAQGTVPNLCRSLKERYEQAITERDRTVLEEIEAAGCDWEKRSHSSSFYKSAIGSCAVVEWSLAGSSKWQMHSVHAANLSKAIEEGEEPSACKSLQVAGAALTAICDRYPQTEDSLIEEQRYSVRQLLSDVVKALMWVKVQPHVYERVRNGCYCRVRVHRYMVEWQVTRGLDRFNVVDGGVVGDIKAARKAALSVANSQ